MTFFLWLSGVGAGFCLACLIAPIYGPLNSSPWGWAALLALFLLTAAARAAGVGMKGE